MLRVGTVLTVCVNFDAKRQENQNLILGTILCRKFIMEGNTTLVPFKRKWKKIQIYFFFRKNNVDREPVHFYTYILKEFISRIFLYIRRKNN